MPKSLLLPTEDETRIDLSFRDGQPPVSLDAIDVDDIVRVVRTNKIPEDSSFEKEFAKEFYQRYQRRLSPMAVTMLCEAKSEAILSVKKNSSEQVAPSGSSEPEPDLPIESYSSSKVSKKSSEPKKSSTTIAPGVR